MIKAGKRDYFSLATENKKIPKESSGVGYIGESSVNLTVRFWCVSGVFGMLLYARGREAQTWRQEVSVAVVNLASLITTSSLSIGLFLCLKF